MEKDLTSIILPAYNAENTIAKSIESVLKQTYQNYKLIIINDGSIDKTESIILSYKDSRILYVKNDINIGLIKTLNKGLELSNGEFIARIDADDTWSDPEKLSFQVHFMKENPNCSLIGTQALFTTRTKTSYPITDAQIRKNILSKNPFIHSSVLFRKQMLRDLRYELEDYLLEDYALWLKLGMRGTLANTEKIMIEYYINPNGETQRHNLLQTQNSLKMIKRFKDKYPNYTKAVLIWNIKIGVRWLSKLLHLK